jgi:hypothetical protein
MKRIYKAVALFILLLSFNNIKAQIVAERRPQLFAAFADKINFPKTELEKIFNTPEGKSIKLSLGTGVGFSGIILSSLQKYENLQSVVIKLNNLDNTILGISKRTNDDKSISFIGRIINTNYADAFELKTDATGNYFINKVKTADLIQDRE